MHVSIIGASGSCGQQIALQLLQGQVLQTHDHIQLVGARQDSPHPFVLEGLREDLLDAYQENSPSITVCHHIREVTGDVIVMVAGRATGTHSADMHVSARDLLARYNLPLMRGIALELSQRKNTALPFVIVVTNPVELAVEVFSQYFPSRQVIGMGAYLDTLRFRKELALDLDLSRKLVSATVLGEHGAGMLPLWSSVKVGNKALDKPSYPSITDVNFSKTVLQHLNTVKQLIKQNDRRGSGMALDYVKALSPDLRTVLMPIAGHFTDAKTAIATGRAVTDLVSILKSGVPTCVPVQFQHSGEGGLYGPCAGLLLLGDRVLEAYGTAGLPQCEQALVEQSAKQIQQKVQGWIMSELTIAADDLSG